MGCAAMTTLRPTRFMSWLGGVRFSISGPYPPAFARLHSCASCGRRSDDPPYLICTCTPAFSRISLIERFGLSKSLENLRIRAERLPRPPKPSFSDL
jgi:hypothetical protein